MQKKERIVKRALVLSALVCRGFIEMDAPEEVADLHERLLPWLEEVDSLDELEEDEKEALQRPLGELRSQEQLNLVWSVEGLAILAWVLGRYSLHPDDEVAQAQSITQALYLFSPKAKTLFSSIMIEKEETIEALLSAVMERLKQTHKLVQNPETFREDLSAQHSIALERARALKWLLADTGVYSEVDIRA